MNKYFFTFVVFIIAFYSCQNDDGVTNTETDSISQPMDTIPTPDPDPNPDPDLQPDPNPEPESMLFYDSFESGDKSATNADGFSWGGSGGNMSIITSSQVVYQGNEQVAIPKSSVENASPDWTAKDGEHSLRFRYLAGGNTAEQRFDLGSAYPEIWCRYWLRVPMNFEHGSDSPSNHKLFALWMDGYSVHGTGPTIVWNPWNNGNDGSRLTLVYKEGGSGGTGPHEQSQPWITYPDDQGRWMQIVLHAKASSGQNTNDALIETYRKWGNETEFTLIHRLEDINMPFPTVGPNGWAAGYIMGWVNAPYAEDTEWLLDQFTVSTNSLLE